MVFITFQFYISGAIFHLRKYLVELSLATKFYTCGFHESFLFLVSLQGTSLERHFLNKHHGFCNSFEKVLFYL